MKSRTRRAIVMLIIAIILFSASMAIPSLHESKYKDFFQGAAIGLMFAVIISIIAILVDHFKSSKAAN